MKTSLKMIWIGLVYSPENAGKKELNPLPTLLNYYQPWETDVTNQLKSSRVQTDPRYQGLTCDPLFQQSDHDPATYAGALVVFLGSAADLVVNPPK